MHLDLRKLFQSIQVTQFQRNRSTWLLDLSHKESKASHIKISKKGSNGQSQLELIGRLAASDQLESGCLKILFHQKQPLIIYFKKRIEFCKRG
jgi:hypothetical protein